MDQEQPNQQQQRPKGQRRRRSNKQKAEDQFDNNAKPKSLEKFFSEVIEDKRENVEIDLHMDIDQRLTDGFDDKIESFVEFSTVSDDKQTSVINDKVADLKAMTNVAIAKKLWTSTPESEKTTVESLKYLKFMDINLPKSINIAIDHLGKVTEEEWICRINHNSLTIERFLFRALQIASADTKFRTNYLSEIERGGKFQEFINQNVDLTFTTSSDSVDWLHEYSHEALKSIMKKEFQVTIGDQHHEITVCYPQLELSSDDDIARENVIEWMKKLTTYHPDWELCADAAIIRLVQLPWLKEKSTPLKQLDPIFSDSHWQDRTLDEVFTNLKLAHFSDFKGLKLREQISSFLFWYQKQTVPLFKRIFNLSAANQASQFGSKSQLIVVDKFKKQKKSTGDITVVANGVEGTSFFKLKDKSSIVQSMIYGFTRRVKVTENYKYRTNGSPDSIKASNISHDFRD